VTNPLLAVLDRVRPWDVLDRPVFVIAAPRSGSTLLFDLLEPHPALVSWPFEAERAFLAARPASRDWALGHRWLPEHADDRLRKDLSRELYLGRLLARRRNGLAVRRVERLALRRIRLLEKTPSNVLRLGALARLYPTARFVYLHRDAPASIGSLVEAWETPSAAHGQVQVDGRSVPWMMLAPPGWLDLVEAPVPVKAAFQWRAATEHALADLAEVDPARVVRLSYEQLVADPQGQLLRVLQHCELEPVPEVLSRSAVVGGTGRTSLSAPRPDKWRARAAEIEPLLPELADLRRALGYEV
jgi:LPS sulfotransferase NodH